MIVQIKKVFLGEKDAQDVNTQVEISDDGGVLDKNSNGYRKIKNVGKVSKVELFDNLSTISADRIASGEDFPIPLFMKHKNKGSNVILWSNTGGITEAIVEVIGH